MSRGGLLPDWLSKAHHRMPHRIIWIAGIASEFLTGVFPIEAVEVLTNIGIIAAFVVVCMSVIIFR